jgi:hypothetical protein
MALRARSAISGVRQRKQSFNPEIPQPMHKRPFLFFTSSLTHSHPLSTPAFASSQVPRDPSGIIDMEILGQVFEMDELDEEDEDGEGSGHEFSKGIVWNYFEQANTTFDEMKEAL